jgi:nucleotide-binding universal stress UspA family protein
MDRDEIEGALRELARELDERGVTARIYLVGGAAMVLAYESRFSTDDVDGSGYPTDEVLAVAAEVAERRGLRPNWLDDSVKVYLPVAREPEWRPVIKVGNVEVAVADERTLLAMKMRASRGRRDEADIQFLIGKCQITSVDDALALYEEYFPEDDLPARAIPMLHHALDGPRH